MGLANQLIPFLASSPQTADTLNQFNLQGTLNRAVVSHFNDQLTVTVDSKNNALKAESLFKRPFQLDALKAQVRVKNLLANTALSIDTAHIESRGMSMNLNGAVTKLEHPTTLIY